MNIALISFYWVNIFPNIFSLINNYPFEMLRFTSIRERSTFFSEPQLFKLRFTHSSECHSNTFTFLGKRLLEDSIFETSCRLYQPKTTCSIRHGDDLRHLAVTKITALSYQVVAGSLRLDC